MEALDLLINRHSQPRLQAPAPQGEVLDNIIAAAMRAPDHAGLSPWRFIVCQGLGLAKLGEILEHAAITADLSQKDIERASQLPLRAPMVVIGVCRYLEHPKVPWVEQVASTASAIHAMQMAALAQGFGGMWRTGHYAQDPVVKQELGLNEQDEIVGFLYLGSVVGDSTPKPPRSPHDVFEYWN